ncbi:MULTISPECIES: TerB family tellurite resistance protein [unclassified Streptomyces]|uniref:TerB family tellurite resistance protein n=1 Tax=unclassified Streptomyces TaxID=2593676 RepID=UPI00202DD9A5|nr:MULTISPECIES: TerB family tellurite resistance protein [unclassified Streptomyces]MCM1976994.1 TerB family tellurite resistance protein [Streptomyces sp. G1]MCX5298508.1 TerB family tellurite resistance protein [Streptomyces sp. NBC_00193]
MLPVRGGDGRKLMVWGIRTTWSTVGDGEFFCPDCGGDRNYRRRTGRRRFTVLGVPLLPRGQAGPVVECQGCRERFATEVLDHLTTTRFSAMLRDAVHTVTLAVLAAGGTTSRSALEAAVGAVRSAGFQDCTEEQLESLVDGLAAEEGRLGLYDGPDCYGAALSIELHEALEPLAPHLAGPGRESILLQGARVALADGPYIPAEREVLATVGSALRIDADEVARLLSAVRAP